MRIKWNQINARRIGAAAMILSDAREQRVRFYSTSYGTWFASVFDSIWRGKQGKLFIPVSKSHQIKSEKLVLTLVKISRRV